MGIAKPFGPIDPNSQHQLWSEWIFTIYTGSKRAPFGEVKYNAAKWLRQGFGSVGRAKLEEQIVTATLPDHSKVLENVVVITVQVEGAPAHDPGYVASVRRGLSRFVEQGWGAMAASTVTVRVLAGDVQDGTPRQQLVVMPSIPV